MVLKLKKVSELKKERELAEFCMSHKTIWLYGAGYVCNRMLKFLINVVGIRPEGILVTQLETNPDNVDGISVFDFKSKRGDIDENDGIIIRSEEHTSELQSQR